jgi:demethylmenaquinone methyltransferase/2-methoxy-6-polyprenyl-1,4-benzoquinol methylase
MKFNSSAEKRRYINQMFARVAHRYDLMNRIMTMGQDKYWRKLLVQQAQFPVNGKVLDIATGTGDIAFESLRQQPNLGHVVGADFTLPMMRIGQQRWARQQQEASQHDAVPAATLSWSAADTLHLPFPDDTFDAVVSGFLIRNVTSVPQALAEQKRVCKPGGRIMILEVPRPPDNLFGALFRFYFHNLVPIVGGFVSGQRDAYAYLPASADAFLRPDELKAEMEIAGLHEVSYTMLMLNTVAIHSGIK